MGYKSLVDAVLCNILPGAPALVEARVAKSPEYEKQYNDVKKLKRDAANAVGSPGKERVAIRLQLDAAELKLKHIESAELTEAATNRTDMPAKEEIDKAFADIMGKDFIRKGKSFHSKDGSDLYVGTYNGKVALSGTTSAKWKGKCTKLAKSLNVEKQTDHIAKCDEHATIKKSPVTEAYSDGHKYTTVHSADQFKKLCTDQGFTIKPQIGGAGKKTYLAINSAGETAGKFTDGLGIFYNNKLDIDLSNISVDDHMVGDQKKVTESMTEQDHQFETWFHIQYRTGFKTTDLPENQWSRLYHSCKKAFNDGVTYGESVDDSTMNESTNKSTKFPDTKEGIIAFFNDSNEVDKSFTARLDLPKCKFTPDPSVEGVWAIDNSETDTRVIVYLGGYKDAMGKIRPYNDFEEGDLTESVMTESRFSSGPRGWAILPATMALYGKKVVDIKTAASEWASDKYKETILVCGKSENGRDRILFIAGSGDGSGYKVGQSSETYHDQTHAQKGIYTILNIVVFSGGEIISNVNEVGMVGKYSLAVFK